MEEKLTKLTVNGTEYTMLLPPHWTLAYVIREKLELTGLKIACDNGACGACTVLLNSEPILSCMKLAVDCDDGKITTIEGLSKDVNLDPIQEAWLQEHGTQCGFCASGMILTAKALLDSNPQPTNIEIKEALSGNICRCGNYNNIVKSVFLAAELKGRKNAR